MMFIRWVHPELRFLHCKCTNLSAGIPAPQHVNEEYAMRPFISKKISQWLLPAVLIMFILEVLTLPLVVQLTYAGRGDGPDHILTYSSNSLVWDDATGIDEHGVAQLNLFDAIYDETVDANGDNAVAPGTEGFNILRLKNESESTVTFTAVLYCIKSNPDLPVEIALQGQNFTDTDSYSLPYDIPREDVLRAVTGTLPADRIQDFDISWLWQFDAGQEQDKIDTILGNKDNLDNITVGVYIIVEDDGQVVPPQPPQTGDGSHLAMYLTLMGISLCVLILLVWDRRREEKRQNEEN